MKLVGKNGKAYSYVQEFSPLNQELPVHLTTYTMPQIEFCKELECGFRFANGFKAVRSLVEGLARLFFDLQRTEIYDGGQEQVGESDHKTIRCPLPSGCSILGGTDPIVGPRPITVYAGTGKDRRRSRKNQPEYPGIRIKYGRVLQKHSGQCNNEQVTQPKDEGISHKRSRPIFDGVLSNSYFLI